MSVNRLYHSWFAQIRQLIGASELSDWVKGKAVAVFEVDGWGVSRRVTGFHADLDAACLSLEVPIDIQQLKQTDISLALDWRLHVREAFETYFERGYVVTDFIGEGQAGSRRNYYILRQMADDLRHWLGVE